MNEKMLACAVEVSYMLYYRLCRLVDVMDEVGVWNVAQVVSTPTADEVRQGSHVLT